MKLNCREKQIFAADNTQNQFAEFAMQFLSHVIKNLNFKSCSFWIPQILLPSAVLHFILCFSVFLEVSQHVRLL